MRLLLDTHALLWFLAGDERHLSPRVRATLADPDNTVFASVVSFWEIAMKVRIGKLDLKVPAVMSAALASGFTVLGLDPPHLVRLMDMPFDPEHRDPFDHLLAAQALAEALTFVSQDSYARRYGAAVLPCT